MTSFIIYYVEGVVDFTDWAMVKLRKKTSPKPKNIFKELTKFKKLR